ncbi:hypothetical protein MRB53_007611 [Persea americana]|uniref:Uncharacterized protein n=1 Tax=Persea americana TaxID=3435 RepID=A0ACC2MJP9_PERAE|nr:hypothetical protein MRB53_007611 [Persea americana]
MACSGGGICQSNCYKEEEGGEKEEERLQKGKRATPKSDSSAVNPVLDDGVLCSKCKDEKSVLSAQPNNPINDAGGLCLSCFRSSLYSKFKLAVTSHSMISPTDKVLVAFSGGPASRVLLQFVHEMQYKAHMNLIASKDRSLPVFGVGVAFVVETAISTVPSYEVDNAIEDIKLIVSSLAPPSKVLHITPIEDIFSSDSTQGGSKLRELLHSITDITGKEDLLQNLRMLCLQKIALANGYNKLVLGSCTSRIACHVISATVKGQGFSLPADIQYVDARREIPVGLPLRDCLAWELKMLCSLDSLKTHQLFDRPNAGINGLVSSFVAVLQEENPSRERTIIRTAEKLTPFYFNKLPESNSSHDQFSSRRRHKPQTVKSDKSIQVENFCLICNSPLNGSDLNILRSKHRSGQTRVDTFAASCCPSCCFQILPKEPSSMEQFLSLLPELMIRRVKEDNKKWLREQIEDCLLSDDEDGT